MCTRQSWQCGQISALIGNQLLKSNKNHRHNQKTNVAAAKNRTIRTLLNLGKHYDTKNRRKSITPLFINSILLGKLWQERYVRAVQGNNPPNFLFVIVQFAHKMIGVDFKSVLKIDAVGGSTLATNIAVNVDLGNAVGAGNALDFF